MVISKCVPIAISRKKFSEFERNTKPDEMVFVGYKKYKDENGVEKTMNIRMNYEIIRDDIIVAIKQDPQWGQGGGGGGTPDVPDNPPDGFEEVVVNEIAPYTLSACFDESGQLIVGKDRVVDTVNNAETTIIDLKNKQGFLEINSGGGYTEEYIYFENPVPGTITNVVVDNTGLPYVYENGKQFTNQGRRFARASQDFVLYYGWYTEDGNYCQPVLIVPPNYRGIVQFLHTKDSLLDIVVHSSCSIAYDAKGEVITGDAVYQPDIVNEDTDTNTPIDATPLSEETEFDIDMEQQKGFIEFVPKGAPEYTFWFSNPEIGSSTYIVINNFDENYKGDVSICYGKRMNPEISEDDVKYEVAIVENERCVIEVFHSLSADIIVKITKV